MTELLTTIVANKDLHSKWLNTLSMMENVGAKKIKRFEHPILVNEVILKHAAEEARHAYYLKKQIGKIEKGSCPTYEKRYVIAPNQSTYYLHHLDIQVCRYLKTKFNLSLYDIKYTAYLLVTYAIEVRADLLYPIYQDVLDTFNSPINVKSIILEEKNHLEEMRLQLKAYSDNWESYCDDVCALESLLYDAWQSGVEEEVGSYVMTGRNIL